MGVDPLLVGLLGVFAGAVIVAIFHCAMACCGPEAVRPTVTTPPRQQHRRSHNNVFSNENDEDDDPSSYPVLDLIVVSSYKKEYEEGGEETCAVCLNEFMEGDEVRILPECCHVFHVLCIDKWLTSRGNCPLCRTDTLIAAVDSVPPSNLSHSSDTISVEADFVLLSDLSFLSQTVASSTRR